MSGRRIHPRRTVTGMRYRVPAIVLIAGLLTGLAAVPSGAVNVSHDRVVSANPADGTPWVNNGRVYALATIGTTMYVGGTFTQVQEANASIYPRNYLFAFDTTTGAISKTFKPALNGSGQRARNRRHVTVRRR